jgi:hypothetical protein
MAKSKLMDINNTIKAKAKAKTLTMDIIITIIITTQMTLLLKAQRTIIQGETII